MSEVLQTNIFFVITSVAVVVFTAFLCIALYYLIGILRNVRDVSERVKRGSEQLAEDAQAFRSFINEGVIGTVKSSFNRMTSRKKGKKRNDEEEDYSDIGE